MPDFRSVMYVVGLLLLALAAAMAVPAMVDGFAGDPDWIPFVGSAAITIFTGGLMTASTRPTHVRIGIREGFLLTTASWLALSFFAALPIFLRGGLSYADAFFEAVSGLTTTGSTVLTGLDRLPRGILIWRSLLQWMGGIGIVAMAIIMLPFLRVGGMQLFRSESSDQSEKVVARPLQLAAYLGVVYVGLTALSAVAFAAAGMTGFDAINHAMTALSTGGYSTHDASLGFYDQPDMHWICTASMAAGALPFTLYIKSIKGEWGALVRDEQVRGFFTLIAFATLSLAVYLWSRGTALDKALTLAAFNVTSIVTTTGFVTSDYSTWGAFPVAAFLLLTVLGGCTGSTAGGIKVFRHQMLFLMANEHVRKLVLPHGTFPRSYNGQRVPDDVIPSVLAFLAAYIGVMAVLALALSAFGLDLVTSLSGAATAISNVGPGLGPIIGPVGNFAPLPEGAKWLLSIGMLLGRLELFTMLVVITPTFWGR